MPSFLDVENAQRHLCDVARQYWLQHNLFTWQWWLLLSLTIIPWLIWWKFADKKRIIEILLYGVLIIIIVIILDTIGANLLLWTYPQRPLWFLMPLLLPIDISIMPVEHMLIYQFFPKWRSFVAALVILALFSAFVAEPLFTLGGMYKLYSWRYVYSVPLYVLKAVLVRLLVEKLREFQAPEH